MYKKNKTIILIDIFFFFHKVKYFFSVINLMYVKRQTQNCVYICWYARVHLRGCSVISSQPLLCCIHIYIHRYMHMFVCVYKCDTRELSFLNTREPRRQNYISQTITRPSFIRPLTPSHLPPFHSPSGRYWQHPRV